MPARSVRAYDPEGMEQRAKLLDGVDYAEDPYACAEGADALVIVTEWDAFRALDLDRVKDALNSGADLVDLRNIYPGRHPPARIHLCERRAAHRLFDQQMGHITYALRSNQKGPGNRWCGFLRFAYMRTSARARA